MTKKGYILLNILLFIAFALFITVFIITSFVSIKEHAVILNLFPVFLMLIGLAVCILTPYTRSAYQLFLGGMFVIVGLFSFLLMESIIFGSLLQWWPIYGIFSGIMLFVSGLYKYKKVDLGFLIPALVLVLLCSVFLLFSFKIVTLSFKSSVLIVGPILIFFLVVSLFVILMCQKKFQNISPLEKDIKQFEDDEIFPEK